MTLNEALAEGVKVTGIGLLIVFSVLVILMAALMLMEKIFYKKPAADSKSAVFEEKDLKPAKAENEKDDSELVAVLAAAVAASLDTSVYNLKIKSYKRVGAAGSAWRKAGLGENFNAGF